MIHWTFCLNVPLFLHSTIISYASCPLHVWRRFTYPACFKESTIKRFRRRESSAIKIGTSFLPLMPISSISLILSPVSGLISVTIFSKSRIITSLLFSLTIPVEILSSALETVAPGLMIFSHDTLCIPFTASTWKAMSNLLKFVIINNPPSLETPLCRQFFKSIAVIIVSLGIKIPSILGCEFGTGVTCW